MCSAGCLCEPEPAYCSLRTKACRLKSPPSGSDAANVMLVLKDLDRSVSCVERHTKIISMVHVRVVVSNIIAVYHQGNIDLICIIRLVLLSKQGFSLCVALRSRICTHAWFQTVFLIIKGPDQRDMLACCLIKGTPKFLLLSIFGRFDLRSRKRNACSHPVQTRPSNSFTFQIYISISANWNSHVQMEPNNPERDTCFGQCTCCFCILEESACCLRAIWNG